MGTRCNIKVIFGSTKVMLYRHWDGYPAETGADLAKRLMALPASLASPTIFLRELLDATYEKQSYESAARQMYEVTDEVHGDIDWAYVVKFSQTFAAPSISVGVAEVRRGSGGLREPGDAQEAAMAEAVTAATVGRPSAQLAEFVKYVNREIADQNRRLAELGRKNPGSAYAKCEPSPLLEMPATGGA